MKKTIAFLLCSLLSVQAFAVEYQPDAVEKKGEVLYLKETGKPLTGTVVRSFTGGQFKSAFVNGLLNGESQGFYSNGKPEHSISFKNNKKEGAFKKFDENGKVIAQSNYKNDKLEGDFITYYPNGTVFLKETYHNDLLNGAKEIRYENGQLKSQSFYKDNLLNGPAKEFYADGKPQSEFTFKDNKKEGISKIYYPNGKMQYEMHYRQNKLDGAGVSYNPDGTIAQKRQYKNGLVISGATYQNKKEVPFTQAQIDELNSKTIIHTQENTYEESGILLDSKTKKPISGVYFVMNKDKTAAEEYQYWNGKPHGLAQKYDVNGKITMQSAYENGQLKVYRIVDEQGNIIKTCQIEKDQEVCK